MGSTGCTPKAKPKEAKALPKESTSRTCRREMAGDGGRWREMAGDGGEARVATGEDGEEAHERRRGHMVGRGEREGRGGG